MPIGSEAYIYKPPTQQEAIRRGRKFKHIDHYIGPGRIIRHIGTRSVVISIRDSNNIDREYQRDAGMVLVKKPMPKRSRNRAREIRWNKNQLNEGHTKECPQGRRAHHPQGRSRSQGLVLRRNTLELS
jgi:hypothetical protein